MQYVSLGYRYWYMRRDHQRSVFHSIVRSKNQPYNILPWLLIFFCSKNSMTSVHVLWYSTTNVCGIVILCVSWEQLSTQVPYILTYTLHGRRVYTIICRVHKNDHMKHMICSSVLTANVIYTTYLLMHNKFIKTFNESSCMVIFIFLLHFLLPSISIYCLSTVVEIQTVVHIYIMYSPYHISYTL
jgi:cation transport ATPase